MMGCLCWHDDISIAATGCEVQAIGLLGYTATRVGFGCRRRRNNLVLNHINNRTMPAIVLDIEGMCGNSINAGCGIDQRCHMALLKGLPEAVRSLLRTASIEQISIGFCLYGSALLGLW